MHRFAPIDAEDVSAAPRDKNTRAYTLSIASPLAMCIYTHTGDEAMRSRDIIKKLRAAGWEEVRQEGSHKQFRHPDRPGTVTVSHPKSDMAIGTIRSIEKQSGVRLR